jgi:predicted O-methyltransferase YrrM
MLVQEPEILQAIEDALTHHRPFGDTRYIREQFQTSLMRRLERVGKQLPAAKRLLHTIVEARASDLHRVLGDTVVRCAVLHVHTQVETGTRYGLPVEQCEEIFDATSCRIQSGRLDTPLADDSLLRLGSQPHHGWIWNEDHQGDIFGRSFRWLLLDRYQALPRTPTGDEINLLRRGAELLEQLLPMLAPSTLAHALVIACVPNAGQWKGSASSSQFLLGGTIFIGQTAPTTWWVAEHLLHEALHQKLYDFRQAHSLLDLEYARVGAPRVYTPWNPPMLNQSNLWDVHRVFAAFHVYVHLGLLTMIAERRAEELAPTYGPFQAIMSSRKALDRARYLGEKLKEVCWGELGLAGQKMADWLISTLDILDPAPPPHGAYFHLCLDRYETEAKRAAATLRDSAPQSRSRHSFELIAREELDSARRILRSVAAHDQAASLDAIATDEGAVDLPQVRIAIGRAFLGASVNAYQLTESGSGDRLFQEMVEHASHGILAAISGYPIAVSTAKRRAHELKFAMSCADEVGRMLTVLAATVPVGGRILEIGTGAGVGTAWIVDGLSHRRDVEVSTVEVDERLIEVVKTAPWPTFVRFLVGDVLKYIDDLRTFDLIFADASPVKYTSLDDVLALLRPGGLIVMDDLGGANVSERQRQDQDGLRRALSDHPDLRSVNVAWSTGLVIAAKMHPSVGRPPARAIPARAPVETSASEENVSVGGP